MVNISQYLRSELINLDLKASTKEEAIRNLGELLRGNSDITDFDQFISDVFEREGLGTTGIGFSLALPHARSKAVKSFVIAIGRLNDGIDFKSLDGEPVKLILLMGTPKDDLGNYLKTLAQLSRLLKKEQFCKSLITAQSPDDVCALFKEMES